MPINPVTACVKLIHCQTAKLSQLCASYSKPTQQTNPAIDQINGYWGETNEGEPFELDAFETSVNNVLLLQHRVSGGGWWNIHEYVTDCAPLSCRSGRNLIG